jgi:hypothetical protein
MISWIYPKEKRRPAHFRDRAPEKTEWGGLKSITLGQFFDHFLFISQSLEVYDPKGLPADKG